MSDHTDVTVEREYCIELPADVVDAIRDRVEGDADARVEAVDAAFDHLETSHEFVTPDGRDLEDVVEERPRSF